MRSQNKPSSGKQKRLAREQKRLVDRAKFVAENPTPYERFADDAAAVRSHVESAIVAHVAAAGRAAHDASMTWSMGKNRKSLPLTIDDLAVGYFAVERVGENGLSYGQLDRCFQTAIGERCHRAKAAAILATLIRLKLIKRTRSYRVGQRGNAYRPIHGNDVDKMLKLL